MSPSNRSSEAEAASVPQATETIWDGVPTTTEYREEVRVHGGMEFRVTRRSLTFPEESRLIAKCSVAGPDGRKHVDYIEFLAGVVNLTVKSTNIGLTPERVRKALPDRPELAWFLITWLCGETMKNLSASSMEDLLKKYGP